MASKVPADQSNTSECESGDEDLDIQKFMAESEKNKQVVVVTAGKSGVGKSTLVNTFMGLKDKNVFKASLGPESVTTCVNYCDKVFDDVQVRLIDMPGLLAADSNKAGIKRKDVMADLKAVTGKGVDVVFHCINLTDRLEKVDYKNLDTLIEAFGDEIWDHIIFVFTHADLVPPTRLKDLIQAFIELLQKHQQEVLKTKKNVEIRSIYSFENIENSTEYYDFNGIVGIPVSENPAHPENWKDKLLVEITKKIRRENLRAVLSLKYMYINWYEAKKTLTITAKGGAKGGAVGGAVGAIIGGIVGGVVTAPAGGVGALGAAAAGIALGTWIGTVSGAGFTGLTVFGTRIAYVIRSRLKLQKLANDRLRTQGGSAASRDEDQTDASQEKKRKKRTCATQ